jgi:hypothetical protein
MPYKESETQHTCLMQTESICLDLEIFVWRNVYNGYARILNGKPACIHCNYSLISNKLKSDIQH